MTLTKNKIVREIGRRTRLKNQDVQAMLEALVEVWTEELIRGGRIEIEDFIVLEVQLIDRGTNLGSLNKTKTVQIPRHIRRVILRTSRRLRNYMKQGGDEE